MMCPSLYNHKHVLKGSRPHVEKGHFLKTSFGSCYSKEKAYYKLIGRWILWEQDFKACRVGIPRMVYFKLCLLPPETVSAPKPVPDPSPSWWENLANAKQSMSCNFWLLNQVPFGSALSVYIPSPVFVQFGELHQGIETRMKSSLCIPHQAVYYPLELHPCRYKSAIWFGQKLPELPILHPYWDRPAQRKVPSVFF